MIPKPYKTEKLEAPVTREALHELAIVWVEEQFSRKGTIPNMMWLFAAGPFVMWLEIDWEDNRAGYLYAMSQLMKRIEAHAYTIISEAWSASTDNLPPDEVQALIDFAEKHGVQALPPHMRDDMLMVTTYDKGGSRLFTRYLVTMRLPGFGLSFLGPRQDEDIGGDIVPVQDVFGGLLK